MYLEEETDKKSEVISCIFSLNEEVGALAKALRLFEVILISPVTTQINAPPHPTYSVSTKSPNVSPELLVIKSMLPRSVLMTIMSSAKTSFVISLK